MKLVLLNTPLGPWAAAFIAQIISAKNGAAALGLPTGSTVEPVYACLRQKIQQNQLSFSAVTTVCIGVRIFFVISIADYLISNSSKHI